MVKSNSEQCENTGLSPDMQQSTKSARGGSLHIIQFLGEDFIQEDSSSLQLDGPYLRVYGPNPIRFGAINLQDLNLLAQSRS